MVSVTVTLAARLGKRPGRLWSALGTNVMVNTLIPNFRAILFIVLAK
jgi:hypothetical protein